MRPVIVVVVLVSAIFVFLQSKTLNQYKDQYSDISVVQALDQSSVVLSSYSFSQVFGVADNATTNNVTATINTASSDKPPPRETWLLDPNSFIPEDVNVIPRTINKIYFQKKSGLPSIDSMSANLTAAHKSWEIMNPGYDIRYFDLDQARKYLHQHFHPVFLRAFDCLPAFASKSDLFRMTLLYREVRNMLHLDTDTLHLNYVVLKANIMAQMWILQRADGIPIGNKFASKNIYSKTFPK